MTTPTKTMAAITHFALYTCALLFCVFASGLKANAGVTPETRPEIFCEFSSHRAPIDKDQVRIYVDGLDVTPQAIVQAWRVSYVPAKPMAPGRHSVRVVVRDHEGSSGEKSWEFTIDPSAGRTQPATFVFSPPTPDNGAVLTSGQNIQIAIDPSTPETSTPAPQDLILTLFRNGSPADIGIPGQWTARNKTLTLNLPDLPPGRYALLLSATGAAREITTAFAVDTAPPRITSFAIEPRLVQSGAAFSANIAIEDDSGDSLDSCILSFMQDGRRISTKKLNASIGPNKILLNTSDIGTKPRGNYSAGILCTDAAGRTTDWTSPAEFSIFTGSSQLQAMDAPSSRDNSRLSLDAPPRTVDVSHIDITGRAPADSLLLLYVNSSSVLERRADSTGAFHFDRVPLEPGDNAIVVALEDSEGITAMESQPVIVSFLTMEEAVATLPDPGGPIVQEPDPPQQTPIDEPIAAPADEPVIDTEPEPTVEPQNPPVVEPDTSVEPEPVVEPEPIIDPEPTIDPEPEPTPDPDPVELTIHVPHGATQGNGHAPVHATAPPGISVTLYLNGTPVATAAPCPRA